MAINFILLKIGIISKKTYTFYEFISYSSGMKVGMEINGVLPLTPPPMPSFSTPTAITVPPLDPDSYREGRTFGFMAIAINALR